METVKQNLEKLGYTVTVFEDKETAMEYLDKQIDNKTVGMGGSVTLVQMRAYERLKTHNTVFWHLPLQDRAEIIKERLSASRAQIYLTSANGLSKKGEIVNVDNTGNRVAASTFGCEKVYFVIGENKIRDTLDEAIYRARNIAAPLNAKRLGLKTPCAMAGDKCYDCNSEQRICRNLSIFWKKPMGCDYEIILIKENLGY